jgi:hypothetical protein
LTGTPDEKLAVLRNIKDKIKKKIKEWMEDISL